MKPAKLSTQESRWLPANLSVGCNALELRFTGFQRFQIVSLIDIMTKFNVRLLLESVQALGNLYSRHDLLGPNNFYAWSGWVKINLDNLESELKLCGEEFAIALRRIKDIRCEFIAPRPSIEKIYNEGKELRRIVEDSLVDKLFMYIPVSSADLYKNDFPYGTEITDAEPKTGYHIAEAAKCLALDRSTACVMHLCVSVEISVRYLQSKAKFTTVFDSDAGGAIVDKAIKEIVPWPNDEKKKQHNQILGDLQGFFRGTRNLAMHGLQKAEKFTETEAKSLFVSTESLLDHLVQLVKDFYP